MILDVKIKMNSHLYLRDPEQSELGRKIVKTGLLLINQIGFEEFTFKKLAKEINTKDPKQKLIKVIEVLARPEDSKHDSDFISEKEAYRLLMWEGSKAYLTRHVQDDNREMHFKPLKSLCAAIATIILEFRPKYKYPHSLASTLMETAYSQKFFMINLPSLTDYKDKKDLNGLQKYLESIVFSILK